MNFTQLELEEFAKSIAREFYDLGERHGVALQMGGYGDGFHTAWLNSKTYANLKRSH